jgi:hypothetical protein
MNRGQLKSQDDGTEAEGRQVHLTGVGNLHAIGLHRDRRRRTRELEVMRLPRQHRHSRDHRHRRRRTSP